MDKYIFFDLDGTLTDPGKGITNSVAYALKKFGIDEPDHTKLYPFIGPPLKNSFMEYYGFDEEKAERGILYYREYYRDKGIYENELCEGVDSLLKELYERGYKLVLATSKPDVFAKTILEYFDIEKYFSFIGGADMSETRVTKSDVIRYILDSLDIKDTSDILMVGDRKYDVCGAREFGIETIGVLYGYGSAEELKSAGAKYLAENTKEVLEKIGI